MARKITTPLYIRLPPELKTNIDTLSNKHNISINSLIEQILERVVKRELRKLCHETIK